MLPRNKIQTYNNLFLLKKKKQQCMLDEMNLKIPGKSYFRCVF